MALCFADNFPDEAAELIRRYSAAGRFYHTWQHIEKLMRHFDLLRDRLFDHEAVELAIFYHDAVYEPLAVDNEQKSAELLGVTLANKIPINTLEKAAVMIESTATHQLPVIEDEESLSDCAYFLDMDIAILGAEKQEFDLYESQIRSEYSVVPVPVFNQGRQKILSNFLKRKNIYYTAYFQEKYELSARDNLKRAIDDLS